MTEDRRSLTSACTRPYFAENVALFRDQSSASYDVARLGIGFVGVPDLRR
jgi:hypothetical protein